jgi:hypothetical protein
LTLYKSLFSFTSMSAGELPMLDIFVSSANIDASVCSRQLGRSFIYNENNNGPKFDPCGTPHLIFFSWEFVPWTVHNWLQLVKLRFSPAMQYCHVYKHNQFLMKWIMIMSWNLHNGIKSSGWVRHCRWSYPSNHNSISRHVSHGNTIICTFFVQTCRK